MSETVELVHWPVEKLVPYARNPRRNDAVVERMCASIREFGFKIPVLAKSDGTVVDGHLRLKAAQKLGIAEVPVIPCDDWSEAQVKAFRLLVNRSVSWADWDDELLRLEIEDLKAFDYDLSLTGFDPNELTAILGGGMPGLTPEDEVPDVPVEPVTRKGDLWILGKHRLLCGDSTFVGDVEKLFGGVTPNLMVTDPPYGVKYDPAWRNEAAKAGKIAFAARREGKVQNDERVDWSDAYSLFPGGVAYIWHAGRFSGQVQQSIENCGFEVRAQIIWAKQRFAISRGHYHWQHEPCLYAVKKGATGNWNGDRSQTTLWRIDAATGDEAKNNHGTQKPVECMRRPMVNHTKEGDAVYDPFLGSGTTIIAAETTGRVAFGLEIDESYCDVIVQRWQAFTGQTAILESTGLTFEAMTPERKGP